MPIATSLLVLYATFVLAVRALDRRFFRPRRPPGALFPSPWFLVACWVPTSFAALELRVLLDAGFAGALFDLFLPCILWGAACLGDVRSSVGFVVGQRDQPWRFWAKRGAVLLLVVFGFSIASLVLEALLLGPPRPDREGVLAHLVAALVIAPVMEELVFRGVLLHAIGARFGIRAAVVATSLAFGLLHESDRLGSCLFGFVAATSYLRSGTLLLPMAMHAAFNAFVFLVSGALVVGGMPGAFVGGCLILVLALLSVPAAIAFVRAEWAELPRGRPLLRRTPPPAAP